MNTYLYKNLDINKKHFKISSKLWKCKPKSSFSQIYQVLVGWSVNIGLLLVKRAWLLKELRVIRFQESKIHPKEMDISHFIFTYRIGHWSKPPCFCNVSYPHHVNKSMYRPPLKTSLYKVKNGFNRVLTILLLFKKIDNGTR